MLMAMILSIIFTMLDILFVTDAIKSALPVGINPFWKIAFVFKLLTDSVILDDFKTALDKLCAFNLNRIEDGWGSRTVMSDHGNNHRETGLRQPPMEVPKGSVQRSPTSSEAWIEVRSETVVESIHMRDVTQPGSRQSGERSF